MLWKFLADLNFLSLSYADKVGIAICIILLIKIKESKNNLIK